MKMILTEKGLRMIFEKGHGYTTAMTGADRLGRGGRPTSSYFQWLEWWVRAYWDELNAMQRAAEKRDEQKRKELNLQVTLPIQGGHR